MRCRSCLRGTTPASGWRRNQHPLALGQLRLQCHGAQAGADVIAHENTKLWLGTEVNSRWEGKVYPPQPDQALPNRTFFYGPQALEFGGTKIEYAHLGQAHTDGDIYVRFPEENVIVAGDVVSPPALSDHRLRQQWLAGWHQDGAQDRGRTLR